VPNEFKRGVYETDYGNCAFVAGPKATKAWDIDAKEWVPIVMVTTKFLRKALPTDLPNAN
jgi:hypothetical protein